MFNRQNLHIMVQVKLFQEKTPDLKVFENQVNDFLQQHSQEIKVVDIRYTAESPNPNNSVWKNWTAMLVYETEKPIQ